MDQAKSPESKGEQPQLQGPHMKRRMQQRQKSRLVISSGNSVQYWGVHRQCVPRLHGDTMVEWRRDGTGKEKDEDWEGGKAGEEGTVIGGVGVR
jgi:hypothetical protein